MCLLVNGYRERAVWISIPNSVRFWFMGSDEESKVYERKVDTADELPALILDLLPAYRSMKINSDEQHTIFAHKLRSASRLMMDFLNIYCEL
jgi:hypothetical protein